MLQTSSGPAAAGLLPFENGPKTAVEGHAASAEEFSQEYDKQVKNIESGESSSKPAGQGKQAEKEQAEPVKASTEKDAEQEANSSAEETAASEEAAGGKNLPLEQIRKMAAEAQVAEFPAEGETETTVLRDTADEKAKVAAEQAEMDKLKIQFETRIDEAVDGVEQATEISADPQAAQVAATMVPTPSIQPAMNESTEELADDALLDEFGMRTKPRESALDSLLARDAKGDRSMGLLRGGKGFEAMLNTLSARGSSTAPAIDPLTTGFAPLAGQGVSNPLATPAPVAMTLAMPMQQANWGQAMAERVVWMSNANVQEAEIQLNPRELGPIGIKLSVNSEQQANVTFTAQHAATREALEQALPRLREMLGENGLQLAQADVSEHGFRGRDEHSESDATHADQDGSGAQTGDEDILAAETIQGVGYVSPRGVDAFV